jgi:hypothetical protein
VPFHVDRDFGADRVGFEAGRKILSRQRLIVDIDQQVIAAESGPVGRATGKNRKDPRPPAFGLNRNTQGWGSVGGRLRAELKSPYRQSLLIRESINPTDVTLEERREI